MNAYILRSYLPLEIIQKLKLYLLGYGTPTANIIAAQLPQMDIIPMCNRDPASRTLWRAKMYITDRHSILSRPFIYKNRRVVIDLHIAKYDNEKRSVDHLNNWHDELSYYHQTYTKMLYRKMNYYDQVFI